MDKIPGSETGGCLCGKVRYQVLGAPNWVAICHCESCRKATGAMLSVYAGFYDKAFCYTSGTVNTHASSEGVERCFCGNCGSSLTYASTRWPGEVHVLVASIDDPSSYVPQAQIYLQDSVPWLSSAHEIAKFHTTPSEEKEGGSDELAKAV